MRQVTTINWYTQKPIVMPVGIAEIGLSGVRLSPESTRAQIPALCTSKLLKIDGRPVWLKISGTIGDAEKLQGLTVSGCGPDAKGITLGAGTHSLEATWGKLTGWDLDRLVLDSAPKGSALAPRTDGSALAAPGTIGLPRPAAPSVRVLSSSASSATVLVSHAKGPFWLVLGESLNVGWEATGPGGRSLGAPQLIDGYANGWYVSAPLQGSFLVTLCFSPQSIVGPAIFVSGASLVLCLLVGFVPAAPIRRRLRRRGAHAAETAAKAPLRSRRQAGRPESSDAGTVPDEIPVLAVALGDEGRSLGLLACLLVAAACGTVATGVLPPPAAPFVGAMIALMALAGLLWSPARSALRLSALGCMIAAGGLTVLGEVRHHYAAGKRLAAQLRARRGARLCRSRRSRGRHRRGARPPAPPTTSSKGKHEQLTGRDPRRLAGEASRSAKRCKSALRIAQERPALWQASLTRAARVPRAVASQVRGVTRSEAARPRRRRSNGSPRTASSLSSKSSSESASMPVMPSSMASTWPGIRVATAGVAQAAASLTVSPQPSRDRGRGDHPGPAVKLDELVRR